ncbi:MAG: hypothetical protein Q7S20_03015 [Gemmatimonadaceae bacterium]|nr:hypothetical protein [Gemmatimonadaceae bacterium]
MTESVPREAASRLAGLAQDWAETSVNERASFQTWMLRFCDALGVEKPDPPTNDYRFELPVSVVDREGRESINYIDCWKAGYFALEAKSSGEGPRNDSLLRKAFGQVRNYVAHVSGDPPPYLMVLDVSRTLIVWDRWSGAYGDFAAGRRIALSTLHERHDDIALLFDIFAQPAARDPRGKAQAVSKEIAGGLAELAAELESRGFDTERVGRFLMRCVFSLFSEDVGLLPENLFRRTLETARHARDKDRLTLALDSLWKTMDTGGMFGAEMLHRFDGHFFQTVEALPLEARDVDLLIEAAKHDWSQVEPSIFGTLLVRALDPEERHRLGAEYTPRAYIERLVEPTVVEPIRERWTAVQAAVLQLEETGKAKDKTAAVKQLRDFHEWMRGLSFLDPACGSGNFLYVTMAAVKRIELEVLNEITRLSGGQGALVLDEVHPRQFHGIEVKPWAREIAELTLWIGYHQFWRESHGGRTPPDPILEDTGTIECRDAVLAWDEIVHRPERDRPDPTPRVVHPVTGELVPDPEAKLPYYEYLGARQAEWPKADFIVGNPPYLGSKRMRDALGDGYVDALRTVYATIPESADFVLYWWYKAGVAVASGAVARAGIITTNSITQVHARPVLQQVRELGARVIWAIPNHPWNDDVDGAAVRVALTVLGQPIDNARLVSIDDAGSVGSIQTATQLNDDLTASADVSEATEQRVLANKGVASMGFALHGAGFLLTAEEAAALLRQSPSLTKIVRPMVAGKDLTQRSRDRWVIDFGYMEESEATSFVQAFEIVRDRVKPERAANARDVLREKWWQFGWPRRELRQALHGLSRYIGTTETAKFRHFQFVDAAIAPDHSVVAIAIDNAAILGVLSSKLHETWALSAGATLEDRPRYTKTLCFDPYCFPVGQPELANRVSAVAERLDAHRKAAIARDERVTMTGMYNVVAKLRSGARLTPKERAIHEIAACGVLRDIHNELDALVAEAYGWPWPMEKEEILERLVALHDERVEEEKRGIIRWLRPDYQIPRFAPAAQQPESTQPEKEISVAVKGEQPRTWPATAVEQLSTIGSLVAQRAVTPDEAMSAFKGARRDLIVRHLETLALMGEITVDAAGRYQAARKVA